MLQYCKAEFVVQFCSKYLTILTKTVVVEDRIKHREPMNFSIKWNYFVECNKFKLRKIKLKINSIIKNLALAFELFPNCDLIIHLTD